MITEFQKKKIDHHFNIVDYNKDNYLTREDFILHGEDYASHIGLPKKECVKKELEAWHMISSACSLDEYNRMSKSEHLKAFAKILSDGPELAVFLWDYIHMIWKFLKKNTHEYIDSNTLIKTMYSSNIKEATEVFKSLDHENKGKISLQELYGFWLDFFWGNNINSPCTWIFGKFNI